MRIDVLGPVVRIELLHALLVTGLWIALLPMRVVEPWALWAGALFVGVNFMLLSMGIRWVLTPFAGKRRVKTGILLLILKLGLFLGLVAALFFRLRLDPLSFAVGFSSLLVAIVWDRVWACRPVGA